MTLKYANELLLLKTKGSATDNDDEESNVVSESEQIFLSRNFFIRFDKKYACNLTAPPLLVSLGMNVFLTEQFDVCCLGI
jgi:hypothetical protein